MTVIKVKNSNVAGRIPAAGDLQPAELAINLQDKKLYSKDVSGQVFEIGVAGDVPTGNTPPSTGNNNGDLFFDTTSNELKYWSGTAWETVTVEPADGEGYVKVSGDTMTGQLTLPGGGSGAEAIQVQEVEALINASDTGAGKYVEVAGDNMTGDLTLGTDKITLDASEGSAEFAGRISGNGECFLGDNNSDPRGYLKIVNNSTNEDDDAIRITDTANNNVAKVRVDGSAEFSGRVLCGTSVNPNIGTGSWLQDNGGIYTTRPAGSSDSAFTAYQQGGADSPTVEINADGSAEFADSVKALTIFADSARFAGQVTSGADPSGGAGTGAILNQTGVVKAGRTADNDVVWQGFHVGESLATSTITASGAATFDSTVKQGDFNGGRTDAVGSVLLDEGGIATQYAQATTASTARAFRVYHGNSEKVTVFADGSADFADGAFKINVDGTTTPANVVFELERDNDANYTTTTEEYKEQELDKPYVPAVDPVVGPRGNVITEGVPAQEATYKTVTKTREVKTYSGPTLDVKDELQSLRARATQQDEVIAMMTAALKDLGADVSKFPAPAKATKKK